MINTFALEIFWCRQSILCSTPKNLKKTDVNFEEMFTVRSNAILKSHLNDLNIKKTCFLSEIAHFLIEARGQREPRAPQNQITLLKHELYLDPPTLPFSCLAELF